MANEVIIGVLSLMWQHLQPILKKNLTVVVKEKRPTCESKRWLLVQHLQPIDIVKKGGCNDGLLVAATNVKRSAPTINKK